MRGDIVVVVDVRYSTDLGGRVDILLPTGKLAKNIDFIQCTFDEHFELTHLEGFY